MKYYYDPSEVAYSIYTDRLAMNIMNDKATLYINKKKANYATTSSTIKTQYICSIEEGEELVRVIREGVYKKIIERYEYPTSSMNYYHEKRFMKKYFNFASTYFDYVCPLSWWFICFYDVVTFYVFIHIILLATLLSL